MRLYIKVKPGSKKDEMIREQDGTIKVRIKAPPVDGKANIYLISYLADYFGLPKSKLTLVRGETNQFKTIEIEADEIYIKNKLDPPAKGY